MDTILTDNQLIALAYIRENPGVNTEDVLNFMVPFSNADDMRHTIANEVGWLIANSYIEKNPRNQALSVWEGEPS